MIKVSDYIIEWLKQKGVDTAFCITGGAAAHLIESLRTSGIKVIHNYNEQACAMAADGYARIAKKPALVLVTNGPGSSNAITGVLGAWQDSIPMFVLSGQVPSHQSQYKQIGLRQGGVQEADIISMVEHCTNHALRLRDNHNIPCQLEKGWDLCTKGRMGPVWYDIPLDIQNKKIENKPPVIDDSFNYSFYKKNTENFNKHFRHILEKLYMSKAPLIIVGNGVHLSNTEEQFIELSKQLMIPVVSSWNASDLFKHDDLFYIGNFGLLGQRAANMAVQEADLVLIFGCRLSVPNTGYNGKEFANNAYKIQIDTDRFEMNKFDLNIDYKINADLQDFIPYLLDQHFDNNNWDDLHLWHQRLVYLKERYPIMDEPHTREEGFINSFDFIEELSNYLTPNDIVVTDMGTSFTCTMQSLKNKGNRLFTSSGLSSMGFGLPGAIGAYMASPKSRIICITGDGGIQMNIQELQTIKHYDIPVYIFVLNNKGYLAISLMQDNLFNKNHFGSDYESGVSSPDFVRVAKAYDISSFKLKNLKDIKKVFKKNTKVVCDIPMVQNQLLIPRVQSKKDEDGNIISGSLETMYPFLEE